MLREDIGQSRKTGQKKDKAGKLYDKWKRDGNRLRKKG